MARIFLKILVEGGLVMIRKGENTLTGDLKNKMANERS
jgi:hypothetical protein